MLGSVDSCVLAGLDVDPSHVQAGKHARVDASKHGLDVIERPRESQPWVLTAQAVRTSPPGGFAADLPGERGGEKHLPG